MIRKQFFEDPVHGFAALKRGETFMQAWRKLLSFEEKTGKSLDNGFTREEYVALFNTMEMRRSSRFGNMKSALMSYVRYLIAHGVLSAEQEKLLATVTVNDIQIKDSDVINYFKNIATLHEAIEETKNYSNYDDLDVFDVPSAILYLAWYGLTEDQIMDYQKSDVLDDGILISGEKVEPPLPILILLKRLRDIDGYYQKAKGFIFRRYVDSPYLIRTDRSNHINLNSFRKILSRFNLVSEQKYSLKFEVVRQSGIFYRAYQLECESGGLDGQSSFCLEDPEFASTVFCEDLSNPVKRKSRILDYGLYKQLFS